MKKNGQIQKDDNSKESFQSISFKIILIGQSSTGKTSMIRSYIHGKFQKDYQVTVGVDFNSKTVKIGNNFIQLQIWDTCGQDVYQSITKSFYRGASAVFLVYSVDNRKSFQDAAKWLQKFKEQGSPLAFLFLIGTKVDLPRQVPQEQALQFMKKNKGAFFIETSALTGENIFTLFEKAAQIMYKCYEINEQFRTFVNPKAENNIVLNRRSSIQYAYHTQVKRKPCCQ